MKSLRLLVPCPRNCGSFDRNDSCSYALSRGRSVVGYCHVARK